MPVEKHKQQIVKADSMDTHPKTRLSQRLSPDTKAYIAIAGTTAAVLLGPGIIDRVKDIAAAPFTDPTGLIIASDEGASSQGDALLALLPREDVQASPPESHQKEDNPFSIPLPTEPSAPRNGILYPIKIKPLPTGYALNNKNIPTLYRKYYMKAGKKQHIPWTVLAGIGMVETTHGRSRLPGVRSGINVYNGRRYCCAGPMQFNLIDGNSPRITKSCKNGTKYSFKKGSTWDTFKSDGNGDGRMCPYDPADAIFSAAKKLRANGLRKRVWSTTATNAILRYNYDMGYVRRVRGWASIYGR